jgi:hypothetical protein
VRSPGVRNTPHTCVGWQDAAAGLPRAALRHRDSGARAAAACGEGAHGGLISRRADTLASGWCGRPDSARLMAVTIAGVLPSGRCRTHTCQLTFGFEEITASLSLRIRASSVPHRRGTQHVVCAVLRRCGPVSGSAHWVLSHELRAPLSATVAGVAPFVRVGGPELTAAASGPACLLLYRGGCRRRPVPPVRCAAIQIRRRASGRLKWCAAARIVEQCGALPDRPNR